MIDVLVLGTTQLRHKYFALKMIKHFDDLRYSHLTKKEREADILPVRTEPKIGRNEPCPCGSGKKYKSCCINKKA